MLLAALPTCRLEWSDEREGERSLNRKSIEKCPEGEEERLIENNVLERGYKWSYMGDCLLQNAIVWYVVMKGKEEWEKCSFKSWSGRRGEFEKG
jgi:hypothetical protein